ncbi:MAG: O-antigen ligase family protein [Thermoanaerobaculia bacterium]|nr:O-antigen ligase family protein [Thermoanaerobaculia bacterium]
MTWLAAAWAGWLLVSAVAAPDPVRGLLGELPRLQGAAGRLAGPLLFLALLPLASPDRTRRWTGWLLVAATAAAAHALLQAAGADPLAWRNPDLSPVVGTQGNPGFLGLVLLVALPWALARLGRGRGSLAAGALPAAAMVAALLLTRSRGVLFGLAFGLVLFGAHRASVRRARLRWLPAGLLAVALLVGCGLAAGAGDAWQEEAGGTGGQRLLLWGAVRELLSSEPARLITGWGPEGLALALPRHLPDELPALAWAPGQYHDRAHNLELDLLASLGVPGLLLGLGLFAAAAWAALRPQGDGGAVPAPSGGAALLAALGGLFVALQFSFLTAGAELLLWLLLLVAPVAGRPAGEPAGEPAAAPSKRARAVQRQEGGLEEALLPVTGLVLVLLLFALRTPPQAAAAPPRWALPALLALAVAGGGCSGGLAARPAGWARLARPARALLARYRAAPREPEAPRRAPRPLPRGRGVGGGGDRPGRGAGEGRGLPGRRVEPGGGEPGGGPPARARSAGPRLALRRSAPGRRGDRARPGAAGAGAAGAGAGRSPRPVPLLAPDPRGAGGGAPRRRGRRSGARPPPGFGRGAPARLGGAPAARSAGRGRAGEPARRLGGRDGRGRAPARTVRGGGALAPARSREGPGERRRASEPRPRAARPGAIPEALDLLERAVALAPRSVESWLLLARARLDAEEAAGALAAARRAVDTDPRRALGRSLAVARAAPRDLRAQRDLALVAAVAGEGRLAADALGAAEALATPADAALLGELRAQLAELGGP